MSKFETEVMTWRMRWNNLFDPKEMKKYVGHKKNYKLRLRLLFKPLHVSVDVSEKDGTATTYYKQHKEKYYIYRVDWKPPKKGKK